MYEYYYHGDCYCVVGTVHAFETEWDMEQYMGSDGVKIDTPDYANDDMLVW